MAGLGRTATRGSGLAPLMLKKPKQNEPSPGELLAGWGDGGEEVA